MRMGQAPALLGLGCAGEEAPVRGSFTPLCSDAYLRVSGSLLPSPESGTPLRGTQAGVSELRPGWAQLEGLWSCGDWRWNSVCLAPACGSALFSDGAVLKCPFFCFILPSPFFPFFLSLSLFSSSSPLLWASLPRSDCLGT